MANFITRILGKLAPEQRSTFTPGWTVGLGGGRAVNPHLAENLATVFACVDAISTGLAALPCYVYRQDGPGRVEVPGHPVAGLIRTPNARQTWPDFLQWLLAQTLLHGNAIAVIESDSAGRLTALTPVPWPWVTVQLVNGQMVYDVVAYHGPFGGTGLPRRYLASEVVHLKDRSDDGYLGRSRLSRAPDVLSAATGLQTYSSAIWENQATPSGALKFAGHLPPEQFRLLRVQTEQSMAGAHNGRKILILDNGADWVPFSVSPEDAEVLMSRRFSGEELARLFGVPPPIIGDLSHGTFTNSETAGRWFAQFCLSPWARKIEAEFSRSVFTDPAYHIEIDLSGLMRGDYAARWAANVAAVGAGILTANEVREQEGFNPLPAGGAP